MFDNKEIQQLTTAVRELVQINRALLTKIESQNKAWLILSDHISKNNENVPSYGVL
jgi:hypothetical protein